MVGHTLSLSTLTDAQLADALGNAAADWALAHKYEHNAHLRPMIQDHLDQLLAEKERRQTLNLRSKEEAP